MQRVLNLVGVVACIATGVLLAAPTVGHATNGKSRLGGPVPSAQFMRVYGQAAPPFGFVEFCGRTPDECRAGPLEDTRFSASAARLIELDEINRLVNSEIAPATDMNLFGVEERWTLPIFGRGDCEDYALLKRHLLIKRGWPISSLLITVVRDEQGSGHAVLTARTAQGDFILDNKVEVIKPWASTGYAFMMRQSYLNPRIWMSLDPKDGAPPAASAGVRLGR